MASVGLRGDGDGSGVAPTKGAVFHKRDDCLEVNRIATSTTVQAKTSATENISCAHFLPTELQCSDFRRVAVIGRTGTHLLASVRSLGVHRVSAPGKAGAI